MTTVGIARLQVGQEDRPAAQPVNAEHLAHPENQWDHNDDWRN